jgi:hypothetical protein
MANYNNNPSLYYSGAHHINKNRKLVRVIETQHRVLKKVKVFVDIETGAEKILPDAVDERMIQRVMQFAQLKGLPVTIEEKYKRMVRWTTTAGCKVLWDEWSPYGYMMTKIPYFPYFRRGVTRGAFHDLLDPQREINRRYNAMLHIIMTTANSGWIYEKGSLDDDMERALEQEGARPGINIVYEKGASQPSRIQPPAPPTTFERLIQMNERDLYDISSINESALGQLDKVQSGRAVQARQQQTLIGTQVYADNFSRSQELLGRLIKHNIQNFYTEPRIVQSVAGNGATEEIVINARTAAGEIVNNVAWGDYQVAIDESPMSATFLNAQFEDAKALRQEMGIPLPDDYMIELSNLPNKEEVLLRLNEDRQMAVQERMLNIVGARASMGLPENMPLPPVPVGDQAIVSVGSAPQGQPVAPENSMVPLRPEVTPI